VGAFFSRYRRDSSPIEGIYFPNLPEESIVQQNVRLEKFYNLNIIPEKAVEIY